MNNNNYCVRVTRIHIRFDKRKLHRSNRQFYSAPLSIEGDNTLARRVEWPTVAVAAGVYGAWAGLLVAAPWIGATAAALFMIPVLVLHSSLQHEILHGHPFRDRRLNELLGTPGLGLYLPYDRFSGTHLAHHDTPDLTDPLADPESYYVRPEDWQRLGPVRRGILQANRSLAGRMLIAPLFFTLGLIRNDLRAIARGDRTILRAWLLHLATVPIVLVLVVQLGGIPLWLYALAGYAALSVLSSNEASSSSGAACSVFCSLTTICTPCIMRSRRCRGTGCPPCTAASATGSCGATAATLIRITAR